MYYFRISFISFIILILFWLLMESGARIALCFRTGSAIFLKHGLKQKQSHENRFEKVFNNKQQVLYYKCSRGSIKNPVNSLGFRGLEIAEKKTSTTRIVCLGGSTTYGLSLVYADSYPAILQDKLDMQFGAGVYEVLNAGVPGHQLPHIINQVADLVMSLKPDIIILMSVFNNLVSDEKDFAFIEIAGDEKNAVRKYLNKTVHFAKKYSVLVMVVDDIAKKGLRNYLKNINWEKGTAAIMRSRSVWIGISENLQTLFSMLTDTNPGVKIFVLDEPLNIIDYPELSAPMEKAYQTQKYICDRYPMVKHLALMPFFTEAQKANKKIWLAAYHDPIHLSRTGNELLADIVYNEIIALTYRTGRLLTVQ